MSGFIGLLLICPILAFELAPPRTLLPVVKSPVGRPLFASEQVEEFKEVANEYATSVAANVQYAIETEAPGFQLLVVGQVSLVLLLLFGEVPLVGDALEFVSGPGLIAAGLILAGAGIVELGPTNLTPFATPVKGNELKTNGIYALSRHPMYCGLLFIGFGLAVATDSFQRLVITAILYLFLDYKATVEEKQLAQIHPGYTAYKSMVPKIVPDVASLLERDEDDDDDGDED